MPNRMLRDWTDSDKMNVVSVYGERFFTRLIMKADDYGCYYADPRLLKSNLFPLVDGLKETDVSRWVDECHTAGLIALYEAGGKRYLEINDFRQRLRLKKRKFPPPPRMTDTCPTSDSHATDICPPEVEEEVEVEAEVEEEVEGPAPKVHNAIVIFDIEKELLNDQKTMEAICMSAGKTLEFATSVLKKYHLWNQEKENYPRSKLALISGFQRWLLNEKNQSKNGQHSASTIGKTFIPD